MEFANGVLNVKWGTTNKLSLEKQKLHEHESRGGIEIYTSVREVTIASVKSLIDVFLRFSHDRIQMDILSVMLRIYYQDVRISGIRI